MKWDVGRGTRRNGKEATMEIENGSHKKQIEGCITSDDAEIYIIACMVVREPLHVHVALVRERECHNTLHVPRY